MRLFDQPCRQHRRDISLLAARALPPAERETVEQHLSACRACREYFAEIRDVTISLAAWGEHLPQVAPDQAAQQRWVRAIREASQCDPHRVERREALDQIPLHQVLWQKLILPSRRTWAGLAAAWALLIIVNLMLRDQSPTTSTKPMTASAIISYGEQQKFLNELFADRSPAVDADRPKNYSPKPRTEKILFFTV